MKTPSANSNPLSLQSIKSHISCLQDLTFAVQVLEGLRQFNTVDALRSNVPVNTVIGVFRDLRGMLEATTSAHHYSIFKLTTPCPDCGFV